MRLSDFGYTTRELTLPQVLQRQVQAFGDKTFLTWIPDGRKFTYRHVDALSNRLANSLLALGVVKGTHVAIMMDNSPEHLLLAFALGKLGAVSVPINTACRGQLLHYYVEQSDSTWMVADAEYVDRVSACEGRLHQLVVFSAGAPAGSTSLPTHDLTTLIAQGADTPVPVEVHCSDTACLAYTSGTTGPSKGNILSQAAQLSFGLSNAEHHGYTSDDVIYICLPLFHVNALQSATFSALVSGGSIAMTQRFSTSRYWSELRAHKVTVTNLLGSMVNFLWSQPPSPDDLDNSVRMMSVVPTPKFATAFGERFGLKVTSSFGMSDFGMSTVFSVNDPVEKLGSAGRARTWYEVKIVDDHDFALPAGETGEIALRCNEPWRTATGYYKMPEATLEARRNQWFHTGDRGYLDADGYLYFVDRKKDAIRRRGENISAFEVEQIIALHPAVAEAAVYPVRAATAEDEVAASVQLRDGARLGEKDLIEFCAANMAYYMVPRFIDLRADFPRTLSQKIQKHLLKQQVEGQLASVWDREQAGIVVKR